MLFETPSVGGWIILILIIRKRLMVWTLPEYVKCPANFENFVRNYGYEICARNVKGNIIAMFSFYTSLIEAAHKL